ncbi:MAG: (Fe-S)-binding protein [Thermomicrobiales bacterium]
MAVPAVRPLIHNGMLDPAKSEVRRIIRENNEDIRSGTAFVVLEPSTASVFRDDLSRLMPHDEDARRLSIQTSTFGEFLMHRDHDLPRWERKAIIHGHCHDKSVLDFDAERNVLRKMGIEFEEPESGCCGMAGSFGYEADHYDISMKIGEMALLPAVRKADSETLIIASGFSCREQVLQGAGVEPMHLAQVVRKAMREADRQDTEHRVQKSQMTTSKRAAVAAGAIAAAAGASAIVWKQRQGD